MEKILLSPPVAFLIFLALSGALYGFGRLLAGPEAPTAAKSSLYTGGESHHMTQGAPGYRQFFTIALFFAILHLGVLMIGSGWMTWNTGLYLIGLVVALVALVLG